MVRLIENIRLLIAVIAAGTATSLCPFVLAVFILATDSRVDNLGRIDNAPWRAAFILMFLSPVTIIL